MHAKENKCKNKTYFLFLNCFRKLNKDLKTQVLLLLRLRKMKNAKQLLIISMICFFLLCPLILMNQHQYMSTEEFINPLKKITANTKADVTADWWSYYGHDPANTRTSTAPAITTDATRIIWSNQFPTWMSSTAVIVDDRVYIGTQYASGPNNIFCYNTITGTLLWSNSTGTSTIYNQPAVFDGKLFVGADDKYVYCFDAETGQQIWKTNQLAGLIRCGITGADGKIFFQTNSNGQVYCLNATNGNILWDSIFNNTYSIVPAVVGNHVYFTSGDGEIACYDTKPQTQVVNPLWKTYIQVAGDNLGSSPAVVDNRLFIGSPDKKLYCFDASTGAPLWNFTTGDKIFSSPGVFNSKVYFSSDDGLLYCLSVNDGSLLWKTTLSDGAKPKSPSIVQDGKLYLSTAINYDVNVSPRIYCFDALTGEENWFYSFDTFSTGSETSDLAIGADGDIYIVMDNTISCLGPNNRPPKPNVPIGETLGKKLRSYEYQVEPVIDPDGDQVMYQWDWDDGSISEWLSTPQTSHIWTRLGTYEIKVRARDSYGTESVWSDALQVTIAAEIPNDLSATLSSLSVREGNEFTVTVTLNAQPLQGAVVQFLGTSKTTDSIGVVSFVAPSVSQDRSYPILITYASYDSITLTETILNEKATPHGWLYGIVYDKSSSVVLEGAQIGIILSADSTRYALSDTEGAYVLSAVPGIYNLIISKDGYETTTITEIVIAENIAAEQNIALTKQQNPSTEQPVSEFIDYALKQKAGTDIGARIDVGTKQNTKISYYSDEVKITMNAQKQAVSFTVSGSEGASPTIIVVSIESDFFSQENTFKVTYDNQNLKEETDVEAFFDLQTTTDPSFLLIQTTTGGTFVLVKTHFSEHTISITSIVQGLTDITGLFVYIGFFTIASTLFVIPVVIAYRRLTRMKKE
jgi:outer membrane protein assembly factor BamB